MISPHCLDVFVLSFVMCTFVSPAAFSPPLPFFHLVSSVILEIDERHQFLDQMRAAGDLSHEPTIKAEISQRLRDLKKLEALMAESSADDGATSSNTTTRAGAAHARR